LLQYGYGLSSIRIRVSIAIYISQILYHNYYHNVIICCTGLLERGRKQLFRLARYIPSVRNKINKELVNVNETFEKDVLRRLKGTSFIVKLPKDGLKNEMILNLVNQYVHLGKTN